MACQGVERCPFPRPISFSSQIVRRSKVIRLVLVPQLLLCQMIKLFVLTLRFPGLLPQLIGATDNIDVLWSCHVLPNLSRPPLAYRGADAGRSPDPEITRRRTKPIANSNCSSVRLARSEKARSFLRAFSSPPGIPIRSRRPVGRWVVLTPDHSWPVIAVSWPVIGAMIVGCG